MKCIKLIELIVYQCIWRAHARLVNWTIIGGSIDYVLLEAWLVTLASFDFYDRLISPSLTTQ